MNVEIFERNLALDDEEQRIAKANRWRFLCRILPHDWHHTHLFDEEPDSSQPYGAHRGSSNYAGICRRCGARDLFMGPYRSPQVTEDTRHD